MNDKIIKGSFGPQPAAGNPDPGNPRQPSPPVLRDDQQRVIGIDPAKIPSDEQSGHFLKGPNGEIIKLTLDQQKALNCILSGMAFVFIGIQPTDRGASFYRAIDGDPTDLRNAHDHLATQIDKAFAAKGLL